MNVGLQKRASVRLPALAAAIAALSLSASVQAASSCASLVGYTVVNTTIVSASLIPASDTLPEYCKVEGYVDAAINFELRLPSVWNGKFLFQGYGGLDGAPPSLIQTLDVGSPGSPLALQRGYSVVTTDTGHSSPPGGTYGDWAINNPEAQVNWAYRSTHVVAEASKQIIASYYGQQARFS